MVRQEGSNYRAEFMPSLNRVVPKLYGQRLNYLNQKQFIKKLLTIKKAASLLPAKCKFLRQHLGEVWRVELTLFGQFVQKECEIKSEFRRITSVRQKF